MPAMRYTFSAADMLSDELRAALRRRLHEIIGAALLGIAGIAAIALATWSVQDPSLSHATNAPVRNMLGLPAWTFGTPLSGVPRFSIAILIGIAAVTMLALAAGFAWRRSDGDDEADEQSAKKTKRAAGIEREEEREPQGFVSLGRVYH